MFKLFDTREDFSTVTVRGVPFAVETAEGEVKPITKGGVTIDGCYETVYFLGMSTENDWCSDWWGQQEALYDHSSRLFFGDRLGSIMFRYTDWSEERVSVLFGVNAFNYSLFFGRGEDGFVEPFRSDPAAKKLLEEMLVLNVSDAPDAAKATKWVFGYKPNPRKCLREISWMKEEGKRAFFVVSGVTGIPAGEADTTGLKTVDQRFFLRKAWYAPTERLRRRLYQYAEDVPVSCELLDIPGFDAPDVRFYGPDGLDLFTNVYRKNVMDMAYSKVTDDGVPHTSSKGAADFGFYTGCGTFNYRGSYSSDIWSRDIGRVLTELANLGYGRRVKATVDMLHEMLYYPAVRYPVPHWKRIANRITDEHQDNSHNEGNENDGHASIMLAIYTLYRKGAVDRAWLVANREHLKAAADYYLWQEKNPEKTDFDGILYTHSETSTQAYGGFDLYSNWISATVMELYARLFDALDETVYADELRGFAARIRSGVRERFLMEHPTLGEVWTDTTDDAWTYEYKRFVELLLAGDWKTLDMHRAEPATFAMQERTFAAQKELFYTPYSGRQLGYGQAYLTGAALMLDKAEEYSECLKATAAMCYHHTDVPYIVPEGVVMHGSGRYWFRNADHGNAVQQAEVLKLVRLMVGVDDLETGRPFTLIPRLPAYMTALEVKDYPVATSAGVKRVSFRYERSAALPLWATDGATAYSLDFVGDCRPGYIRFGPFGSDHITTSGTLLETVEINGQYYAYVAE